MDELLHFLAEERNFDLRGYKPTTLERRIRKRMGQRSLGDFGSYVEHIRANPGETNQLLDTILINVTEFFRDPEAWEIVANDILPPLLKRLDRKSTRLNSSHVSISYAVFCLKKKKKYTILL